MGLDINKKAEQSEGTSPKSVSRLSLDSPALIASLSRISSAGPVPHFICGACPAFHLRGLSRHLRGLSRISSAGPVP
jgi:hypothetical protein